MSIKIYIVNEKRINYFFAAVILMVFTLSCAKEAKEEPSQPTDAVMGAVTGTAIHVSCRNATISGRLISPQTLSLDLSYGVIYSPSNGMQTEDIIRIEAKSLDSDNIFSVTTNILEPETTYYYRCFMSQSGEITYGEVKSFKTLAVSSMIQTLDATDITPKDAALNASLDLTDCRYDALEYGFEVTPEGGSSHTIKSSNLSEKKFSAKDESLSRDTKYSVVAYVKLDGRTYKGEAKTFKTLKSCPTGAVDLGLSVYWATCNIGASKPEDYGGYYQWAGTKYVPSDASSYWSGSGSPDNKTVLDPEDDVAHVKLGGKWRMPTYEEWRELRDNCTWTWTSQNGIQGYRVTSKKSGYTSKFIFLPAAGYRGSDCCYNAGSRGDYWSSSLISYNPFYACYLFFNSDAVGTGGDFSPRYAGQSVRPVSE